MNVNDSVFIANYLLIPATTMSSNDSGRNDHCSEVILRVQKEDGLWLMSN